VVVGEAGGVECEVFFPRGMYWYVDHCTGRPRSLAALVPTAVESNPLLLLIGMRGVCRYLYSLYSRYSRYSLYSLYSLGMRGVCRYRGPRR
jgi:hypothetical protein